jgi:hypothetical protein
VVVVPKRKNLFGDACATKWLEANMRTFSIILALGVAACTLRSGSSTGQLDQPDANTGSNGTDGGSGCHGDHDAGIDHDAGGYNSDGGWYYPDAGWYNPDGGWWDLDAGSPGDGNWGSGGDDGGIIEPVDAANWHFDAH